MTRRRSPIALLCAIIALLAVPALAHAHGASFTHSDPIVAMPDELVIAPVIQDDWTSTTPGLTWDNERSGGLPETWCGTPTAADNTVDQVSSDTGPHFKLIYAYASDQPNRFAALADKLQASVSLLTRYLAGQSGGAKTVRIDLGTDCGPEYVDIQTVALPQPTSYYVIAGVPNAQRLNDDVRAAVALAPGSRRNLLVYADALRGTDGVGGSGQRYTTLGVADQPGAANPHNDGGLLSIAWGASALPSGTYAEPATLMHELSHNLGAVQGSAPHTTDPANGGHCTDEQDLLCYADGGPQNTLTYPCDYRSGQDIDETYDCGRDDYFDPAPAPGSYLDQYWNVYNSEHLVSCADLEAGASCGDPDTTPPVNTTPAAPSTWQTAPYAVVLSGTDGESGVDHMAWRVDGGGVTSAGNGDTITLSSSGVFTLETRAVDEAGNPSAWRSETVRIDLGNPSDITDPGTVAWRPTTTSVAVWATDAVSGVDHVEWELDGGALQTGPNGSSVSIVADGEHTLRTWAVDVAGNRSTARVHTIRVDTVTPTDTTAAPGGWQTAALPVTVAGTDAHSGIAQVTYELDGAAPQTGLSPTVVNVSGDGDHELRTFVRDNAGNESGWKTTTIRIDTTAPANQTPLADSDWRGDDYAVMVSGADDGSGLSRVEWRVNGGPAARGASPLQATVTGNGTHTLETRAVDVAGNASGWRSETIRIDKVAPVNTTTPEPSSPVGNGYVVTLGGTDTPSGVDRIEWQLDGGETQSGTPGDTVTISGFGTHTLRTRVVDLAGNASTWRTDEIEVDADPGDATPPVDVTTAAPAEWRTGPIPVTVAADDAESTVVELQWRLDGVIASSLDADPHITITGEGEHLLETRARNSAGRVSCWREQTFKIDSSFPTDDTVILSEWTNSRTITLAGTDAVSGIAEIEYRIGNSGPFLHGTDDQVVDLGADGTFTIWHRAIDHAGHATQRVAQQLRIDTADPTNTSAVPDPAWRPTPLSLDLAGTDATSGVDTMQWRLDGGDVHDGGPAIVDTDGEHVLETRAVDNAGNDTDWRPDTVRVDVTAPINETPAIDDAWRSTPYSVTVAGSDGAGSGVTGVEVKVDDGPVSTDPDVTVSGDGVHKLETRILDAVGHASDWQTDTIRIDSVIPTAALSCPAGWQRLAVFCTATANGGPSGVTLTASRNGGAFTAVTGGKVPVTADGDHTITLKAVDGAGNQKTVAARVKVDRRLPVASLSCAAAKTPTGYTCRAAASDATSGVAALAYSVGGGAWTPVPAGGAFTVAKGTVRVRALDAAGNQALTGVLTLADRSRPDTDDAGTMRTTSVAVYLKGRQNRQSMVGALHAARSANGTVSIDLRPLAVGRGKYRVQIVLKSGKRKRTVTRTVKVGRGGTLRRMSASLSRAPARTTVTLTVRKRRGSKWRSYARAKAVLAK